MCWIVIFFFCITGLICNHCSGYKAIKALIVILYCFHSNNPFTRICMADAPHNPSIFVPLIQQTATGNLNLRSLREQGLNTVPTHHRAQSHPVILQHMSVDSERTCNLQTQREEVGIKPLTTEVWCKLINH